MELCDVMSTTSAPMGSLHLAVESWRTKFDVAVPYTLVFQMPVEFDLKLMTVVP